MASLERRIQKLFSLVDYAGVESRVLVELGVDAGKLCEDWGSGRGPRVMGRVFDVETL
jgi:hypothetical protein